MINPQSATYNQIFTRLTGFSQLNLGGGRNAAVLTAKSILISHVTGQAFVKAVCDDFLIAAIISLAGVLPILILKTGKRLKAN